MMRRYWKEGVRGVVLLAAVCVALSARPQTANPNTAAGNATGYGGVPTMMVAPQVAAPDFTGMTLQEAQAANVLVPTTKGAAPRPIFSSLNPIGPAGGVVATQTPPGGTKVYPGRQAATLTMKAAQTKVPSLQGMSVDAARSQLAQSFLLLGRIAGEKTKGTALKIATQTPAAGTSVDLNSSVDVVLEAPAGVEGSSGSTGVQGIGDVPPSAQVRVPDVLKLGAGEAAVKLASAGLGKPVVLGQADGVVVLQKPAAGLLVAAETRVRLTMGIQEHTILIPQPPASPWGWWVGGGVVLLGSVLAIGYGMRRPTPPTPTPGPGVAVVTAMLTKMNPMSAKVTMKTEPVLRWSVQWRDRPAAGVTVVKNEIEGVRRGEG